MSTTDWRARVRAALSLGQALPDDDVVEELAQHVAQLYDAARAEGVAAAEAEARVVGYIERWRQDAAVLRHRPRRRTAAVVPPAPASRASGLVQDVRYAMRLLRRQPRPALVAVLTLALGLGATTTLFSVAYGVLLKPLPWPTAGRVVVLKETRGGAAARFGDVTNAAYLAWRERAETIEGLAAWSSRVATLSDGGGAERAPIVAATPSLFPVLGARPLIGGFFRPGDEGVPVVVISERLWRQRFAADREVVGRALRLDGRAHTVVGVLPDGVAFPSSETAAIVPLEVRPAVDNQLSTFAAMALLRPGVSPSQAAAEGTARGRFAPDSGMTTFALFGQAGPIAITARPLEEALADDVRTPLIVLLIAVGLLLATATANIASLQLAAASARTRELAIRSALGADAARVSRQLLVEAGCLGVIALGGALVLAYGLHRALPTLLPADFPRVDGLGLDGRVVAFAILISMGTTLAVGLAPARRARRLSLTEALSEDGASPVGLGVRTRTGRTRLVILAGQVAAACVLLVGGTLLGRSFVATLTADRGYDMDHVLSALLTVPQSMFPQPSQRVAVIDQLLARVQAVPGVVEAAFTSETPLALGGSTTTFPMVGPKGGEVQVQASPRIVSPRYFAALRLRIVEGRPFSAGDTEAAPPVVLVNKAFARRYLGDAPLGARLPIAAYAHVDGPAIQATVVGVVDDVRYVSRTSVSQPELDYAYSQFRRALPIQTITLMVRTAGRPEDVAGALREAVHATDANLVAERVMPLEARLLRTLARPRLYAVLLGAFAGVALVIVAVGLFGLVSQSVSLRSRELAIRTALGARRSDIIRLVVTQGLGVTAIGVVIGLGLSAWGARALAAQLYGVTIHDPATFIGVPAGLLAVAAIACAVPARRAARTHPLSLLRR